MRELRLPYKRFPISVHRPAIQVHLMRGNKVVPFWGLVDSGADESIFPGWVGKSLGYDVESGQRKIFTGIGGSVVSYGHRAQLNLDGIIFTMEAHYSHQWDDMPFGLLGQDGFFSQFQEIIFNYNKKVVTLKY